MPSFYSASSSGGQCRAVFSKASKDYLVEVLEQYHTIMAFIPSTLYGVKNRPIVCVCVCVCVIFFFFFFFSNVVTICKVRENSGWIRSRNLKAPSIAIRVQLACTPRKFREGKAGEHTEVKRRGRLLASLSLANHHFSVSSLC